MGVKPRPGKVLVVTTGLGVGGAEAMLTRLVTAQPSIADDVTVVVCGRRTTMSNGCARQG